MTEDLELRVISGPQMYTSKTVKPVEHIMLRRAGGEVMGFIYCNDEDDAAGWVAREGASPDAQNDAAFWMRILRDCKGRGLKPGEALDKMLLAANPRSHIVPGSRMVSASLAELCSRAAITRCRRGGFVVGVGYDIPADPTELNFESLPPIGCNQLRCTKCGERVASVVDGSRRMYSCSCSQWGETDVQPLEGHDDNRFLNAPNVPWRCEGHPPIVLPHDIDGCAVATQSELAALVRRAIGGEYPPPARTAETRDGDWLVRLLWRLLPGDRKAVLDTVTECLGDSDDRARARALRFFARVAHEPARARLLDLATGGALDDLAWRVLAPHVGADGPGRELARAEALAGRGGGELFRALAAGDPEWFLANAPKVADITPARAEEFFDSFAHVPESLCREEPYLRVRDMVRHAISERITLDEALERTSAPVAAWDCGEHYDARLCVFETKGWGAMLMKAAAIEPPELETWNERVRARGGQVGASHGHSELVWTFDDADSGIWTKTWRIARGDSRRLLLQGRPVTPPEIVQVSPFVDATEELIHRGVRCRLVSGEDVIVHEERDSDPPRDLENPGESVALESAWTGYLGVDLATWLGVPLVDSRGAVINTRPLAVRSRIHAFAAELEAGAAANCSLGRYDGEDLFLVWQSGLLTLRIGSRDRVMLRGEIVQAVRYLRNFITPRRLLAAARGGY